MSTNMTAQDASTSDGVDTAGSTSLQSIVGGNGQDFFDNVWQKSCRVYRCNPQIPENNENRLLEEPSPEWNDDQVRENPFTELIRNGWFALIDVLEHARRRFHDNDDDNSDNDMLPLVFCQQRPLDVQHVQSTYSGNLFSCYLDGCSVVLNHADWACPYMASLCLDLQKSFPHAYANAYLTPPSSRAVPPHADDRDVLVIQLVGEKQWNVYERVPIPYPYPHEQVGKDGLTIPPSVLEGPCVVDTILKPGDVLYMPRGFVHQACTTHSQPSFHVTIALATHDWTLSRILSTAMQQCLDNHVEYRMAVPLSLGMQDYANVPLADKQHVQQLVEEAFETVKRRVTMESISRHLHTKYERHNQRALSKRMVRIHEARFPKAMQSSNHAVVGLDAALGISLRSIVRAATAEEKARVVASRNQEQQQAGLHVRPEIANAVMGFLAKLKSGDPPTCRVAELPSLLDDQPSGLVCNLTLLSFAKCCVELGALAVVDQ